MRLMVRDVAYRDGRTLYLVWGPWPPFLLAVALVVAANVADRHRSVQVVPGANPTGTT